MGGLLKNSCSIILLMWENTGFGFKGNKKKSAFTPAWWQIHLFKPHLPTSLVLSSIKPHPHGNLCLLQPDQQLLKWEKPPGQQGRKFLWVFYSFAFFDVSGATRGTSALSQGWELLCPLRVLTNPSLTLVQQIPALKCHHLPPVCHLGRAAHQQGW